MQSVRRSARARSFGSVVDDYDKGRPTYPTEAVMWLTGRAPANVLDLGAGTGKLTVQLSEIGHEVIAAELSRRMVARLRDRLARVSAVCAAAEAIPLQDGWANAVTVGQAFHWFDLDRALPEIARVLGSGGRLGLIWNHRDERIPWVRDLSEIIRSEPRRHELWQSKLDRSPLFGQVELRTFGFEQMLNREELLALVRSRSYVATLDEQDRISVLDSVRRFCDEHPDLAGRQEFGLPYETVAYSATRAG